MNNGAFEMKEYEILKQEISEHQKRREQLFLFTITALGVVLGFTLKVDGITFLVISLIPFFLIFNFCRSTAINSIHIICIGTYIVHFIESKHKESFHWETIWNEIAEKGGQKKAGYWYHFGLFSLIFICIGLILLIFFTNKLDFLKLNQLSFLRWFLALFYIMLSCLCAWKGVWKIHWGKLNNKTRKKWNNRWQELKENM